MGLLDQLFAPRSAAKRTPAGLQDPFARREAADRAEKRALALAVRRRESTDVPGWPQADDTADAAAAAVTEPGWRTLLAMPQPADGPLPGRKRVTLPVGRTSGLGSF